ncbi:MAG: PEP-CTERM sorting domain-containing protein [Phycisphaerae bacterium]|nr:PEP-CTERM sorting domain-containing protein [Tepidisphaeraceae bacterium]
MALSLCGTAQAAIVQATVGTYGVAGVELNSSGNAKASTADTDVTGFATLVATDFAAGRGGVIQFEVGANATDTVINATYASGAKTLPITFSESFNDQTFTSATPISGSRAALTPLTDDASDDSSLTFGSIGGGEAVRKVGFTLLSRTAGTNGYPISVTVTANLSGGGTQTISNVTIPGGNGTGDTFFAFIAPEGQAITGLAFDVLNETVAGDRRLVIDDLAFSTVPEPSVLGLVSAGLLLGARRRRRRA